MQIKNANKYRKALIAVIHSPKMFHVFQGTGIDILDVYVTKDGKFAKVLFATPFQDRRESLARKLEVNAGKLKSYVSTILKSKNTPRLTFVDAEKRKMEYARETAAFEEIRRERIERGEEEEEGEEGEEGEESVALPKDDGRLIRKR
jgi:ribosome-binding factor A|tara:strand:+ start:2353 stop:2793 length:441 start_codon:yes stop_codon:yes gene_type:complete